MQITRSVLFAMALSAIGAACSDPDPFMNTGDGGGGSSDGGGGGSDGGGGGDAPPPRNCAPAPARLVVLGDSITACSVVGGPQNANCVSKKLADYVTTNYAAGLVYQNLAVGGAKLDDIAGQLANIQAATGPALVYLYIGGNDLSPFIFQSDSAAMNAWTNTISPKLDSVYAAVFAKLADTSLFPAGATLLMNTQYNPFDDCTASPYNLSQAKTDILHMFNDKLRSIAAAKGDAAIIVDQHGPYLGHGHHYNVAACPHYMAGSAPFMQDQIHANAAGNTQLAAIAGGGADRLYRDCIQ